MKPGLARAVLLALLFVVPLVPDPGIFTNHDAPKWAVLTLGVIVALLLAGARAVAVKDGVKVKLPEHLSLLALLVVAAFFLANRAHDARATNLAWAQVGTLCAAGLLATRYLFEGEAASKAFVVATVSATAAALIGIAGAFGLPWGSAATFGNASFGAEYCTPALFLAAALFVLGRRKLALGMGLPILAYLVVARSRADWLGLAAGAAVLGFFEIASRKGWRIRPRLMTGVLLVGTLALPYAIQVLPVPVLGRSDTIRIRELTRAGALEIALDHPVAGVGLDGFEAAYHEVRDPEEFERSLRRDVGFPHNLPLSVFAETGLPGLAFLLFFLWIGLSAGVRSLLRRPDDGIAFGALGATVAVLVSAQFSGPLRHPSSALLFFVLTAILTARKPRRYVTELRGRYRKAVPVVMMAVGPIALAVLLPSHLLADHHLRSARDRAATMDAEFARRLEASVAAEPSPDALRMLAHYHLVRQPPDHDKALAILNDLFEISPHYSLGRLEKARALAMRGEKDDRDEARKLLENLSVTRRGDPFVAMELARILLAEEQYAQVEDLLAPFAESEPNNGYLMLLRAEALAKLDRVDEIAAVLDPIASDAVAGRRLPPGIREDFDRLRVPALIAAMKTAGLDDAGRYAREISSLFPRETKRVAIMAERIGKADRDRAMRILTNLLGPAAAFYRAVVLAGHGEYDAAMRAIRESVDGGFATRDLLSVYPGLEPLRARADFRTLLR